MEVHVIEENDKLEDDDEVEGSSDENEEPNYSQTVWKFAVFPKKFYEQYQCQEHNGQCKCKKCVNRKMDDVQKELFQLEIANDSSTKLSVNEASAQAPAAKEHSDYSSNVNEGPEKQLDYSKPPSWYYMYKACYHTPKAEDDDGGLIDKELYQAMGFATFYSNKDEYCKLE